VSGVDCKFAGGSGTDFLAWLNVSVEQANQAASEHEALKLEIRALREKLEDIFLLRAVHVHFSQTSASLQKGPKLLRSWADATWKLFTNVAPQSIGWGPHLQLQKPCFFLPHHVRGIALCRMASVTGVLVSKGGITNELSCGSEGDVTHHC